MPLKQPHREKWIREIEKVQPFDYIVQMYYLCQYHFSPNDIESRGKKKIIIPGRVPSIFANNNNNDNVLNCHDENAVDVSIKDIESIISSSNVGNTLNTECLSHTISNPDEYHDR